MYVFHIVSAGVSIWMTWNMKRVKKVCVSPRMSNIRISKNKY